MEEIINQYTKGVSQLKLVEETTANCQIMKAYVVYYIDLSQWKNKYHKVFDSLEKAEEFYLKERVRIYGK